MTQFIHIADLHHARHTGNAISAEHSSFSIQRDKLNQLRHIIQSEGISAVLIAGDIEVSKPEDFLPYLIEWTNLGASVYLVYGDHDIDRTAYHACWGRIAGVHSFLEPGYVFDEKLGAGIYGLSCETNQMGLKEQFSNVPDRSDVHPNIFLGHGDRKTFLRSKIDTAGFTYYALGHHHRYEVIRRSLAQLVYPGHVFSVWDGCGKAWPTGFVIGTVSPQGITHTFRKFKGPETRRISFNPFIQNDGRIQIELDNIEFENDSINWIENDTPKLRTFVRSILEAYPNDYFVTPSDAKRFVTRRMCMTGHTLLEDAEQFETFFTRSFKATKTTQ